MFKRKPILAGNSDLNQTQIIFDLVGSPTEDNMPGWSQLPGCDGVKQFAPRRGNLPHVFRECVKTLLGNKLLLTEYQSRILGDFASARTSQIGLEEADQCDRRPSAPVFQGTPEACTT